jgi:uncharacterized protein (TIGR00255 family)
MPDRSAAPSADDEDDERHARALRGSVAAGSDGVNRNILTLQEISPYDHWMAASRITPVPALRSMTGFGRAEATGDAATVTVEARSVNHRHLDIALRLPRTLGAFEMDARRMIQSRLERGRIDVAVQLGPAPGQCAQQIRVDAPLAAQYVAEARELGRTVGLGGDVTLAWVLERPGVVRTQDTEAPAAGIAWPVLAEVLGQALDELVACRGTEGAALGAELRALHAALRTQVDVIEARTPAALARYQERLRERIGALLGEVVLDEGRILTEVAIWADKTDVREEMTRLRAHLEQLTVLLDKGGAAGRALDFLIQELNREVNTIASKADDLELSQAALAAKGIIEKMREQAQNLE